MEVEIDKIEDKLMNERDGRNDEEYIWGKEGQYSKETRNSKSLAGKIAKKIKQKVWQEWPVWDGSGKPYGQKRESSTLPKKDLKKWFKHGKDNGDYTKTA